MTPEELQEVGVSNNDEMWGENGKFCPYYVKYRREYSCQIIQSEGICAFYHAPLGKNKKYWCSKPIKKTSDCNWNGFGLTPRPTIGENP